MSSTSDRRQLGTAGPAVFPVALGCMGMTGFYGPADERESIATIHAALDRGVNLLDTGDYYAFGANEMLIGRALKGRKDRPLISVKFGGMRSPDGAWTGYDARPAAVKNFVGYSLARLGVETIDIYRPGRLDSSVPIEETIGAIADLVKAGHVRYIGLSEVGVETIRRAQAVHPIVDLQIEYSLVSRGPEAKILPLLSEMGIGVTAYGVLSRGLLTRSVTTRPGDFRAYLPRFSGENRAQNLRLVETLEKVATRMGVSPAQLAIAWVLSRGKNIVPVLGARTQAQLSETLGALDMKLGAEDLAQLEEAVPPSAVAGSRYGDAQMKVLDSER